MPYALRLPYPRKTSSLTGNWVRKEVTTDECACDSYRLPSLFTIGHGPRPYTLTRESGNDPNDDEHYPAFPCTSPFRQDARLAVLYTFSLHLETHLQIKLSATNSDPKLTLWNDTTMGVEQENDNTDETPGSQDAQIAKLFSPGDYTIEVGVSGTAGANPTYELEVTAQEKMERYGHQSDHTVQFELTASMPQPPAPEARWFPGAIRAAAERWDTRATRTTPEVKFCEDCSADNADNVTVLHSGEREQYHLRRPGWQRRYRLRGCR